MTSISSFSTSEHPGMGTLNMLARIKTLSAASAMKYPRTARAITLPLSMCTTALGAYINSNNSCKPNAAIRWPMDPR